MRATAAELTRLPDVWLAPQGSEIAGVEWFILGAVKRTSSLVDGFATLLQWNNTLSAAALLRLRIDTAMRIHGLSLVKDAEAAGELLMGGLRYDRLQDRSGAKLSDKLLHESLSKTYPWVTPSYTDASDFVHLSGRHMKESIGAEINGMIFFNLNGTEPARPPTYYFQLADTFNMAVDVTSELIWDFAGVNPGPKVRKHGWRDR